MLFMKPRISASKASLEANMDKRTAKRKLGDLGETICCDYLTKHGFEVIERNYLRKWGEIDVVARKNGVIRFIEVKSARQNDSVGLVSCVTLPDVSHATNNDSYRPKTDLSVRPTNHNDSFRPEENVHPQKLKRLARTMQTYLLEKRIDSDWQLDIVTVKIDEKKRIARVEMIENVII